MEQSKSWIYYIDLNIYIYINFQWCPFFNISKINYKVTIRGYKNKSLYHKYVYNKIKYVLLMIWEICQDNKLVTIKNIYTSLNSGYALVKLTDGV